MPEITRAYLTELITFNPTVQRIGIQKVYQFDVHLLALPDGRYRGLLCYPWHGTVVVIREGTIEDVMCELFTSVHELVELRPGDSIENCLRGTCPPTASELAKAATILGDLIKRG